MIEGGEVSVVFPKLQWLKGVVSHDTRCVLMLLLLLLLRAPHSLLVEGSQDQSYDFSRCYVSDPGRVTTFLELRCTETNILDIVQIANNLSP